MSDRVLINNDFILNAPKNQFAAHKNSPHDATQSRTLPLVIVISVFLVLVLLVIMMMSSLRIEILGAELLSKGDIEQIAGLKDVHSIFLLDIEKIKANLSSCYKIKTADIHFSFPNQIVINIQERKPVGIILAESQYGYDFICIDDDGILIGYDNEYLQINMLPLISGIVLKNYKLGNKLDARFIPVLRGIYKLKSENQKLYEEISEFKLEEKTNGYLEVVVYPVTFHTAMRMGTTVDASVLQIGIWMLDALKEKAGAIELKELDLRGKVYSIKFKEAVSG